MPKPQFNLAGYALVADRITSFYERFPTGRIFTDLISNGEEVVFRAEAYREATDTFPAATGWASERKNDGEINEVACLENTETSAIGRALANLGFTASRLRPSYEEMQKAERARLRFQSASNLPSDESDAQPILKVSEGRYGRDSSVSGVGDLRKRTNRGSTLGEVITNRTSDVLALLAEARKKKIPAHVLEKFSRQIGNGFLTEDDLGRMERQLRHWILNGYPNDPPKSSSEPDRAPNPVNTPSQ
jgi:hypothetical protein